jgi:DNA segregation ATPase FtsK/SpoIIIE, S-DNA-T family
MMLLPGLMTAGVMVAIGLAAGMSNWLVYSVPMILVSSLASVITYFSQRKSQRAKKADREKRYAALLARYGQTLENLREQQRRILLRTDPSPEECLQQVAQLGRSLWARSPEDSDFLAVRIGLSDGVSSVSVRTPDAHDPLDPDPLIVAAQELGSRYSMVPNVPICLDLRKTGVVGLTGARADVLSAARAMAIQIATHHSPDDVKIAAIFSDVEGDEWAWLRWLPHVWSPNKALRYLACDREGVQRLLGVTNDVLNQRRQFVVDMQGGERAIQFPYSLVVFVADMGLAEESPVMQRLQAEGPSLGVYPIFLSDRFRALPRDCEAAIKVDPVESFVTFLEARVSRLFSPDGASREEAEQLATAMAPIRLRRPATARDIPETLSLLDLLGAQEVESLGVLDRWRRSEASGRSLAVPIGMRAGGEPLILDLHERVHGPNGLVAGMVGAGKSELLQTLVTAMAVNYHPHRVAFVLVDYKGGGMADPFVGLPHTLGVITNLQQGNLAVRALASFNVEAQRRQRLFAEAGVNHIDAYQRLYYRGQVTEPLPYLVIIVDEFAEMKTEQPDVAKEFVRIARLGRALGFRLILAMQKPAGIVDGQIEANTRFRLCLRVAQPEDSQAMLKRPEAAYLGGVGRAYFQVGVNEVFELFQVAWSGAPYDPSGADADDPLAIVAVGLDGSRTTLYQPTRQGANTERTQLEAVADHLAEVAVQAGIEPLPGPWLPPLPPALSLQDARPARGWTGSGWVAHERWLQPVVGTFDDPSRRAQGPLEVPLGQEGHLLVYGAPGYGKTVFLQTLVTSLALDHSPAEVNLYLLDCGGRLLKLFEPLPHVGAVITADETERRHRLLRFLAAQIEWRQERCGAQGVATLADYRRVSDESIPAIVVVIDSYAGFVEAHEEDEDAIVQILRDGAAVGVHLVITVTSSSTIRYKLSSNVNLAVALHLVEEGEYAGLVGRLDGALPEALPGRGLLKGNPPVEFQTALPIQGSIDAERVVALRSMIRAMADAWNEASACPIETLPDVVDLRDILARVDGAEEGAVVSDDQLVVPMGLGIDDLSPWYLDLGSEPACLVVGPSQSGKTSLLRTLLLSTAQTGCGHDVELYLIDSRRRGLYPLRMLPAVAGYAQEPDEAEALLQTVESRLETRRRDAIDASPDAAARRGGPSSDGSTILLVVDDILDPFDDITSESCRERLGGLVRIGRRHGLRMLVTGCSDDLASHGWSEPIKSLRALQCGFVLGVADDSVLNLRLSYAERDKVLPAGEAYYLRRGRSTRVKIALPPSGERELGTLVETLLAESRATSPDCQSPADGLVTN